jgi:hypothetical protein
VKEFYSNVTNIHQKKKEVMMRGKGILYSKANINWFYGIDTSEDAYYPTLHIIEEKELNKIMKHLTIPGTEWNIGVGENEKTIQRMSLKPVPMLWYQIIKHSIIPTTHNEGSCSLAKSTIRRRERG